MTYYDTLYFRFIEGASIKSAKALLPIVERMFHPRSVADFGCGSGSWLRVWKALGVEKVMGLDGPYIQKDSLLIEAKEFRAVDLTQPVDLCENFDLVQCLEVAEHLPASGAERLVESLVRHGKVILFSAAPPGQGGCNHINEQPYEYWRTIFQTHGYVMLDLLRSELVQMIDCSDGFMHVEGLHPCYALNSFIFVHADLLRSLPPALVERAVSEGPIIDYSPALFKIRKAFLRCLPVGVVTLLHKLKKHLFLLKHKLTDDQYIGSPS